MYGKNAAQFSVLWFIEEAYISQESLVIGIQFFVVASWLLFKCLLKTLLRINSSVMFSSIFGQYTVYDFYQIVKVRLINIGFSSKLGCNLQSISSSLKVLLTQFFHVGKTNDSCFFVWLSFHFRISKLFDSKIASIMQLACLYVNLEKISA